MALESECSPEGPAQRVGFTVWLTGLPCSGKSTIADKLAGDLRARGHRVQECERRDVKGLYAQARAGVIENFTGVSDPYEPPHNPEVTVCTDAEGVEQSVRRVLAVLVASRLTRSVGSQ